MNSDHSYPDMHLIDKARSALQKGDKRSARTLAIKATQNAPENEEAWLILAAVSELQESIQYLKRALEINPKSIKARKGLHWAALQLKQSQREANLAKEDVTNVKQKDSPVKGRRKKGLQLANTAGLEEVKAAKKSTRSNHWPISLFVTLVLAGLTAFCMLGIPSIEAQSYFAKDSRPENALPKPTLTPTLTPTPSPTATPSPTPTILPTMTPAPVGSADQEFSSYHYRSWEIPEQVSGTDDFWVEVDLTGQILHAYRGDRLISSFLVSTGTNSHPTITGTYKVYAKFPTYTMRGPGYDLPDVPYSMFFYKGYSIHGTYWHSNFGTPMSHGCVNMQTDEAAWLYDHVKIGTYVFVHY